MSNIGIIAKSEKFVRIFCNFLLTLLPCLGIMGIVCDCFDTTHTTFCAYKRGFYMTRFKVEKKYYYRFFCALLLAAVATAMYGGSLMLFARSHGAAALQAETGRMPVLLMVYLLLYSLLATKLKGFKIGVDHKGNIITSQEFALLLSNAAMVLITTGVLGMPEKAGLIALYMLLLFLAQSLLITVLCILSVNLYRRMFPPLRVVEIYGDYKNKLFEKVESLKYKYHIVKRIHYSEVNLDRLDAECDAVLINDIPSCERNELLKQCYAQDRRVYFVPKISDILVKQSKYLTLIETPLCLNRNIGISLSQRFLKRTFDIVLSVLALTLTSPVFAAVAIAIKLDDGGPVFFKQERCTIGGKPFKIFKFRSMIVNAENSGKAQLATEDDDRITRVGHFIRATRIDELPQLINILKGDMSVVGPRPERGELIEHYSKKIAEFPFRTKMKGGLTGYAQVYGKYNTTALDKLKLDLVYITGYSLLLDFQIIFQTFKVIFQSESTEGFESEHQTGIEEDY